MLSVADTEGARLWAFDVEAPGVLRAPAPFRPHRGRVSAGLPGNTRFDSVAVMASGTSAVATLTTGSGDRVLTGGRSGTRGQEAGWVSDHHVLWRPR
jgi:gluconolactonase